MTTTEMHQYTAGSRGAVLINIRDAILAHEASMHEIQSGVRELPIGDYVIHYALPGSQRGQPTHSLTIWPRGVTPSGYSQGVLTSFQWDKLDQLAVSAFNHGEWLNDLLRTLRATEKPTPG